MALKKVHSGICLDSKSPILFAKRKEDGLFDTISKEGVFFKNLGLAPFSPREELLRI
jgi:hypothetical protein